MPDLTPAPDGLPVLALPTAEAWEAWLDEHGDSARGLWLRLGPEAPGSASVTAAEAREVALCFGWVAGQKASDEAPWWRQRFTPRSARTRWSQVDRDAVLRLQEQGRLRQGGLRAVADARADGRWDAAYAPPSSTQVPDDLRTALDAVPAAADAFAGLDATNRSAVLHRVTTAKRAAARQRRIEEFVAMLADGRTPYPPRPTEPG